MTISEIKSVKKNADIVKAISHFVNLKKDGASYVAPCPFHDERSNSFRVSPIKGIFKCFGCGKSGDVVDFVIAKNSYNYYQAVQWIADHQNIIPDKEYVSEHIVEPDPSFVGKSVLKSSLGKGSNFKSWVLSKFPDADLSDYMLGSSKHWKGSVVFWYVDVNGNIRSGKIMQYNSETGKRIKSPTPLVTWVHKVLRIKGFEFSVCLYGEHLLKKYPEKPVCIVESEKSAIIASIVYPGSIWLACGGITYLSEKRCACLLGRDVTLYPDVGGEEQWQTKMDYLVKVIPANWSMKKMDSDVKGYDICDMIVEKI